MPNDGQADWSFFSSSLKCKTEKVWNIDVNKLDMLDVASR